MGYLGLFPQLQQTRGFTVPGRAAAAQGLGQPCVREQGACWQCLAPGWLELCPSNQNSLRERKQINHLIHGESCHNQTCRRLRVISGWGGRGMGLSTLQESESKRLKAPHC